MAECSKRWVACGVMVLSAALAFLPGINWGLPSRAADPFLFGSREPWTGAQILQLAGPWTPDAGKGADVDINPIARGQNVLLNETDAQRAEIVRRYRLFSYQPDEMITFRALAGMKPGTLQLDPRLYQYGGLWIYPVGALLKVFAEVRGDVAYYLDHPEAFGRFYVIARLYSAAWGVVGMAWVFFLTRRVAGGLLVPTLAAVCFAWMPVVVNAAHEAKPHLGGTALMLMTVIAAARYLDRPTLSRMLATGSLAGLAVGMVLSSLPVCVVPVVAVMLVPLAKRDRFKHLALAAIAAVIAYSITNPYVLVNLAINRAVLRSNFGNSAAMYPAGSWYGGIGNGIYLIWAAAATVGVAAVAGVAFWGRRMMKEKPMLLLLAAPASLVLIQFLIFANNKPGEYARFALFAVSALDVIAISTIDRVGGERWRALIFVVLFSEVIAGGRYVQGFWRDSRVSTSRTEEARTLSQIPGAYVFGVTAEPAPYCLPPLNLFDRKLVLIRSSTTEPRADVVVDLRAASDPTPISWADKAFTISSP